MKVAIAFGGLFMAFHSTAIAHDITFSPIFALPVGSFAKNTTALTMGIDTAYNWQFTNVSVVASLGFWAYGKQALPAKTIDPAVSDAIEFQFDNNLFHGGVGARYRWPSDGIQPYVQGITGIMGIYTEVSSRDGSSVESLRIVGTKLVQSSTTPYGQVGIGALIPLRQTAYSRSGRVGFSANIDINLNYFMTGEIEYYSISSVQISNNAVQITRFKGPIQMMMASAGINLAF